MKMEDLTTIKTIKDLLDELPEDIEEREIENIVEDIRFIVNSEIYKQEKAFLMA